MGTGRFPEHMTLTDEQKHQVRELYRITDERKDKVMTDTQTRADEAFMAAPIDASEVPGLLIEGTESKAVPTAEITGYPIQINSIRVFQKENPDQFGHKEGLVALYTPLSGDTSDGEDQEVYLPIRMKPRLEQFFAVYPGRSLTCRIFKNPVINGQEFKGFQLLGLDQIPEDNTNRRLAVTPTTS